MDPMRKRFDWIRRYLKAPDEGGGGASSSPAPSGDGGGASVSSPSSDGGGGSSPSPSPSSDSTPSSSPWESLGSTDDLDHIEIPDQPAPVTPAPQAPPVAPVPPPVATPPAAPTAQPQTPPAAQQPPTTPPAGQQPSPQLSPSDPVGIAEAMHANRNEVISALAQDRFALSQEDLAEFETDIATAIPKFAARVMLESQISMMKFLSQAVPGMIQRHGNVSKANNEAESEFFETHKSLGLDSKNDDHRQLAFRMASLYRQANPNMPMKQLIAEVGPMVAASLQANGKLTVPVATPAAPVAQPRGGTPFRPAVNGGGGASPAPAQQSEWAGLGANYDDN